MSRKKLEDTVPIPDKILCTFEEAALLTSLSRDTVQALAMDLHAVVLLGKKCKRVNLHIFRERIDELTVNGDENGLL